MSEVQTWLGLRMLTLKWWFAFQQPKLHDCLGALCLALVPAATTTQLSPADTVCAGDGRHWRSTAWTNELLKFAAVHTWQFIFFIFILSTSQLHSKMFFLKTCLLLRYKSTYFSHVVHASVMQYKKITSWWLDVNNSNTKH